MLGHIRHLSAAEEDLLTCLFLFYLVVSAKLVCDKPGVPGDEELLIVLDGFVNEACDMAWAIVAAEDR